MTPLDKPLKRELVIGKVTYTLAIASDGLKLVEKGKRKGLELAWNDLMTEDAGLAAAVLASVQHE